MSEGRALGNARKNKNDEYYTRIEDIELELKHYKNQFYNKVVLCNCDDPYESNFFKYFALNFNSLNLKKLICTCYDGSPIIGEQISFFNTPKNIEISKKAYKIELTKVDDFNNDGATDLSDIKEILKHRKLVRQLKGDGDFRSDECVKLLEEADIVVTNPPFSLFREYVNQLIEYNKQFIILGNPNAISYKEIFPLIKDNKIWLGYKSQGTDIYFHIPDNYKKELLKNNKEGSGYKIVNGEIMGRTQAIWYTNLDTTKRHEDIIFYKKYNSKEYPKYENFDAINVAKISEIPNDYYDVMGVPLTFIDKYNPEQFRILGLGAGELGVEAGVQPYDRKLKKLSSALRDGIPFIYDRENNKVKVPYIRIFIQRIREE